MKVHKEEQVTLASGGLTLEGLLSRGDGRRGLVISHPHPLYGGEMGNHVVGIIQEVFAGKGWTTLRFNFRGTGRSQGKYDEGVGEQEDVRAAVRYLQGQGLQEIFLAGYSFGAWVNAQAALELPEVSGTILVAPPQTMMDFSFLQDDAQTKLVIVGEWDTFGPLGEIRKVFGGMRTPPQLRIIPEADHFFNGATADLRQDLESFLKEIN